MTIPKASISDLINLTSSSTGQPSAQMTPQTNTGYVNDFLGTLSKYAQPVIQPVENAIHSMQQNNQNTFNQGVSHGSVGPAYQRMEQTAPTFLKGYLKSNEPTEKFSHSPEGQKAMTSAMTGTIGEGAGITKNILGKAKEAKSVARITLKPSVYGAGREAAVQKTVDTLVSGASASEKYANLQPTMDTIGKQIDTINKSTPINIPISRIAHDYNNSLNELRTGKVIDTKSGKAEVANFLNNLYRESPNAEGITPHANAGDIIDANLEPVPSTTMGESINPSLSKSVRDTQGNLLPSQYGGFDLNPAPASIENAQYGVEGNGRTVLHPNAENPQMGPTHLTGEDLYSMYKQANKYNAKALAKRANGTPLTATEEVQVAGRDVLGSILAKENPQVKDLITTQSHLYDAAEPLFSAREAEVKAAAQPKPGILQQIKAHPIGSIALGALGLEGVRGFNDVSNVAGTSAGLINSALSNKQPPTVSPKSSNQPSTTKQTPRYTAQTPIDDGSIMTEQDFGKQQAALQKKIGEEKLYDPQQANTDQGAYESNKQLYDAQGSIRQLSTQTQGITNTANNAYNDIQAADPSVINALNQGFDSFSKANGGKYAKMAADLKTMSTMSGIDLSTAKSKEALQAAIDAIVQNQQAKLKASMTTYGGNGAQPSPQATGLPATPTQIKQAPVNWQQNDPRVQSILNQ